MKETGIIMSGSHPRDILEGRKTMTRRTWGLEFINKTPDTWRYVWNSLSQQHEFYDAYYTDAPPVIVKCPYGQVGDLLRVKETWAICSFSDNFAKESQLQVAYRAGETVVNPHPDGMTHSLEWRTVDYETWQKYACQKYHSWQPSLFMPKAFARIWLPITGLRAERLQDITEEDALAEGIKIMQGTWQAMERDIETGKLKLVGEPQPFTARYHYKALWDSLNAKRGFPWEANHWVWPISFRLIN